MHTGHGEACRAESIWQWPTHQAHAARGLPELLASEATLRCLRA